jgi:AcrR family transcriptional regulator
MNPSMKKSPAAPPAKERLLATAARLFEAQGYESTGINQIIAEAQTAKASFYDHFASKELLGHEYLARYGRKHLALLQMMMQRSATPQEFIAAWVRLIKRQNRSGLFYGCPMANLRAQIGTGSPVLAGAIATLAAETIEAISGYLRAFYGERAGTARHARAVARRIFHVYEGGVHVWRLTGDDAALDDIEPLCLAVLARDCC